MKESVIMRVPARDFRDEFPIVSSTVVSLSHGHICCECLCLPNCAELQQQTEVTDGSKTIPTGKAPLQFSEREGSIVYHM